MKLLDRPIYRFAEVEIDAGLGTVTCAGQERYLRQQTFQVLLYLLEHRDRIVNKEELIGEVWNGAAVTDNALVQCIADIRRALGDDSRQPRFVRTLPKFGYRFIATVEVGHPSATAMTTIQTEEITSVEFEFKETDSLVEMNGRARESLQVAAHGTPARVLHRRRVLLFSALGLILVISLVGIYPGKLFLKSDQRLADVPLPWIAGKKAVAVLPFANLSGNRELDWLREGLADMLINTMSRSKRLAVLNRQQLHLILQRNGYKTGDEIAPSAALEIARHCRAEVIVLGSFANLNERIRIDLQLYDAGSGDLLATEHLVEDRQEQILTEIDLLSLKLAARLGVTPADRDGQRELAEAMTSNMDAYRYYSLALERAQMFQFHESVALLEKAIALDSQFAMAYARIGYVYAVRMGDGQKARPYLEKALALGDRLGEKERLFISAWLASAIRDPERAIEVYRDLIARYPLETEAYQRLGWVLERLNRNEEALEVIKQGLVTDPEHKDLHNALGSVCLRLGRNEEALAALERYTELAPNDPNAWDSLGLFHQWVGRYDEAEAAYHRALALNPESSVAVIHLGHLRFQQGRYREALDQYKRFSQIATNDAGRARGYTFQSQVYLTKGDLPRAVAAAKQEVRYNPNSLWNTLALALARRDEARIARLSRDFFTPAVYEAQRERGELRFWEYQNGTVALAHGRAEEALDHFRAASQHHAFEWYIDSYEDCLANAYLELGRWDEAIAEYERILKINPNYPLAHYRLAQAYEQKGEADRARVAYEQFLQTWKHADADIPEVIAARKRLAGQPAL